MSRWLCALLWVCTGGVDFVHGCALGVSVVVCSLCAGGVEVVVCSLCALGVSRWLCVVCVCWGCRGGCV